MTAAAPIVAPPPAVPPQPLPQPPRISVVVPAYEAAATIGETIASILEQSPAAHEIVVVDDGSSDAIEAALEPFAGRLRLLRRPHRGVAAARNAGWRECDGDFVLVTDADDVLLPGKIEALARLGQARPDLDLLCTDLYFELDGQRRGRFGDQNPFPAEGQRAAILERCFPIQPATRRSCLEAIGGFDESLRTAEDWDCALRLILAGSHAGLHDEPLAVYRIHPGSLTDARTSTLRDRTRMLEKALVLPTLRPPERRLLDRALRSQRARSALAQAQAGLARDRDSRRLGLALARTPAAGARARLWGLAVFAAPRRLRPLLRRRAAAHSQLARQLPGEGSEESGT